MKIGSKEEVGKVRREFDKDKVDKEIIGKTARKIGEFYGCSE